MAIFGSLGGLGGLGSSYPQRRAAPNSKAVEWIPDAENWLTDFTGRYGDELSKPGGGYLPGTELMQGGRSYNEAIASNYDSTINDAMRRATLLQIGVDPDAAWAQNIQADWTGGTGYDTPINNGASHRIMDGTMQYARSLQDTSALDAERGRLAPLLANQVRQRQAYARMNGNNMLNGMLNEDYKLPDFGQITGNFGQDNVGVPTPDMSWTGGAGATGVYGSATAPRKYWGI